MSDTQSKGRAATVKTPGVVSEEVETVQEAQAATPAATALPADLQALVQAEVLRLTSKAVQPVAAIPLPDHDTALTEANKSGKAVLSSSGYVCPIPSKKAA